MTDLAADLMIANAEIKQLKAENEILRQRLDNECDSCACEIANERDSLRADLIESLQAQLKRKEGAIQEWIDGVCISQKHLSQIGKLQAQLAASQRRERAAVEDLETAVSCITCVHDFDCEHSNSCGCSTGEYKWRGPQETGEESR